jgi:protease I
MASELKGKTIAILAADGVEQVELEQPRQAVQAAGAVTELLSIKPGEIQAVNHDIHPSVTFTVDRLVGEASADDYDALILPGEPSIPIICGRTRRPSDLSAALSTAASRSA